MKEVTRKCVLCGASPSTDPSVVLHRFPKPGVTNVMRCEGWAKFVFPHKQWSDPTFHMKLYAEHRMLCTNHFTDYAYADMGLRQKLLKHAIPCLKSADSCVVPAEGVPPATGDAPSVLVKEINTTEGIDISPANPAESVIQSVIVPSVLVKKTNNTRVPVDKIVAVPDPPDNTIVVDNRLATTTNSYNNEDHSYYPLDEDGHTESIDSPAVVPEGSLPATGTAPSILYKAINFTKVTSVPVYKVVVIPDPPDNTIVEDNQLPVTSYSDIIEDHSYCLLDTNTHTQTKETPECNKCIEYLEEIQRLHKIIDDLKKGNK